MSCQNTENLFIPDNNCTKYITRQIVIDRYRLKFSFMIIQPGSQIYSGNARVYLNNNNMPLGPTYFTQPIIKQYKPSPSDTHHVQYYASDKVDLAWFGTLGTARIYSNESAEMNGLDIDACKNTDTTGGNNSKCVMSFTVTHPTVLLMIGTFRSIPNKLEDQPGVINVQNMYKMLNYFSNQSLADRIKRVMDIIYFSSPTNTFRRKSYYTYDREWLEFFRDEFIPEFFKKYIPDLTIDGVIQDIQTTHHEEIVLFNSSKILVRDYNDQNDMQSVDLRKSVKKYMKKQSMDESTIDDIVKQINLLTYFMSSFETTNYNLHSGNLIEHSLWCALNIEYTLQSTREKWITYVNSHTLKWTIENHTWNVPFSGLHSLIIAAGYFHDIGKMVFVRKDFIKTRIGFVYYDVKNHSLDGATLLRQSHPISVNNNSLKLKTILYFMTFEIHKGHSTFRQWCRFFVAWIITHHWELGTMYGNYKNNISTFHKHLAEHIQGPWLTSFIQYLQFFEFIPRATVRSMYLNAIIALWIVSIADISAQQPFVQNKREKTSALDVSMHFPWIVNRGRVYPGSTMFSKNVPAITDALNQFIYDYLNTTIDKIKFTDIKPVELAPEIEQPPMDINIAPPAPSIPFTVTPNVIGWEQEPMDWSPAPEELMEWSPAPEELMDWSPGY